MTEEEKNESSSLPVGMPAQIGPYRVLDVLGEGGMAVVYLAEQSEPVKRRVALKILKAGMDSKQVVARFESERQALAVLDHPNIAKIFDGGIAENGRPYFAMEHVKGVPITEYCDDHRLNNIARLRLFVDTCAAVQHAHLKGLIHRDLKPSNILVGVVDGEPQPKIIDFGIAKATTTTLTEATLYTKVGQIIGTPQYMSPEQAGISGLDVDTRSDIYSLGVVLYELLVGVVPLDLEAIGDHAMQIALKEKDPPRPSTRFTQLEDTREEIAKVRGTDADGLKQDLAGDLDWVVMKAIEKDRTRRYETVNALAMECKRYCRKEPVLARPPSSGYLLRRFVQRNRLAVVAGAITILAVVAGATAATFGYLRATEAERVALQEAETARQVSDFLVELFEVSDPSEARGNEITAREVLDRGVDTIQTTLVDQPDVQTTLMQTMAKVYFGLGLQIDAQSILSSALNIRRTLLPDDLEALASLENELCEISMQNGELSTAENHCAVALEIRRSLYGDDSAEVGTTLSNLATVRYYQSEYEQSRDLFAESLQVFEKTLGLDHPDSINTVSSLGSLNWRTGNLDEAERLQRLALRLKIEVDGSDHPDVAIMMNNLGILLSDLGRDDESEPFFLESLEMQRRQLGEHPSVANSLNNVGMFYFESGSLEKAEPMMQEALAMWQRTLGESNPKIFVAKGNLGQLYIEMNELGRAEAFLTESLVGYQGIAEEDPEGVALSQAHLCKVFVLTNRFSECEEIIVDAIQTFESILPPGHDRTAGARILLGMSLGGQGEFEAGEKLVLQGFENFDDPERSSFTVRQARRSVARFYELWGKPETATKYQ